MAEFNSEMFWIRLLWMPRRFRMNCGNTAPSWINYCNLFRAPIWCPLLEGLVFRNWVKHKKQNSIYVVVKRWREARKKIPRMNWYRGWKACPTKTCTPTGQKTGNPEKMSKILLFPNKACVHVYHEEEPFWTSPFKSSGGILWKWERKSNVKFHEEQYLFKTFP